MKMDDLSKMQNSLDQELYQKRKKIYPREVHGLFARFRTAGVLILLGLYYGMPWVTWGGRQAVLLDLPQRQFHIFGLTFWPQDFFYLAVLLILAALSLFFFTAVAGRLWCGYACPQTVWTEAFLWMERKIEGNRSQQMKLDKSKLSSRKLMLKGTKHTVWILFSLWTGFTFVGYFTPITDLASGIINTNLGPWESFWIFFYGFATYGNAGWMREQVCTYMCPYARFQSAMFDKDTLVISYDSERGDPRGSRRRGEDYKAKGLGECVNCQLCVQVCPTGIDIRDGLQYQCIGCAACVDVCDSVMEKVGYPKGLVRYTTENGLAGKATHILRPRIVIYAVLLMSLFAGLIYAVSQRVPVELDVIRDRNALYRETNEGLTENVYTLKLINMDTQAHEYTLSVDGLPDIELISETEIFRVASGEVLNIPVRVQVDPVVLKKPTNEISFTVNATDDADIHQEQTARFIGSVIQ